MLDNLLLLGLTALLIVLNGFFVAAEFAIVKVRTTRIDELVAQGSRRAAVAQGIVKHLDSYLAACQVGITFASIALGFVGEPAIAEIVAPLLARAGITSPAAIHTVAGGIAFAAISFLHIVIGEQAPKAAAIASAERTTLNIAIPLWLFHFLLYPAIWVTNSAANLMLRLLGLKQASEADLAYSPDELEMVVEASAKAGLLNEQERRLLENAINLSEQRVREIMVPRPDMICFDATKPLAKNLLIVSENQHTRYPLTTDDRERVIGMVHVKDLVQALARGETDFSLEKISRPVIFVPEIAPLDRVLRTFQRSRTHLAIVVDEYGGLAGLVTLEDVLEEIVGPIRDEFDGDERDPTLEVKAGGEHLIDAGLPLAEIAESFKFEPVHANVDTVGGYVLQLLGRLPKVGDAVTIGRWRVEVAEMHGLRVMKLRFKPRDERAAQRMTTPAPPIPAPLRPPAPPAAPAS